MALNDMDDFMSKYEDDDKEFVELIIENQNQAYKASQAGQHDIARHKYSFARFLMGIDDYQHWR